jgi:hypothetical protein
VLVESPVAFQKMVKDGLDKSVHDVASPLPSSQHRWRKHVPKSESRSKSLRELQLEASRRGVDQVCSFAAQTSLYGEISRASLDDQWRASFDEGGTGGTRKAMLSNDLSWRMQSLSLGSLQWHPLESYSAEQNIEAARSISCVDQIFKENGDKGLVPR